MQDDDIRFARALADVAGEAIRPFFRTAFDIEQKADASPVTQADRAAEAAMRAMIERYHPDDGIIGEEYGAIREGAERVWVLDPIDGTRSFTIGRPIFGTLIALVEAGQPIIGVIDQPIAGERWVGARERPTTFDGVRCMTRPRGGLEGALVATTSPHLFASEGQAARFLALADRASSGRPRQATVYGGDCYNYGLLASGHIDIVAETGLQLYDFAALVPVVEGAGGVMRDWSGRPLDIESRGDVVALGEPELLGEVVQILGH